MNQERRPSQRRMNILALSILIDAAKRARRGPIDRSAAHRLALAWLVHNRIAEAWQADGFWQMIGSPPEEAGPHTDYCRIRDFRIRIGNWQRQAGLPEDMGWSHE